MLLVARDLTRLERTADLVEAEGCPRVRVSADVGNIQQADVVVTVTSSGGNLIKPDMLKSGAVVCDVSRPRDLSLRASRARDDVLVIDGGLVRVPGNVDFGFNYGVPPNLTYGCIAETMTLAFEGLFQDFSLGKQISLEQIRQIDTLAAKHGFELAALRSFEHKLDDALIQRVRVNAHAGGRG
jgi:predicted amino acid dehydrogenase